MGSRTLLSVYAIGWIGWMLAFAVLDANGATRQADIWWALAGATLWPLCLPFGLFLFFFR